MKVEDASVIMRMAIPEAKIIHSVDLDVGLSYLGRRVGEVAECGRLVEDVGMIPSWLQRIEAETPAELVQIYMGAVATLYRNGEIELTGCLLIHTTRLEHAGGATTSGCDDGDAWHSTTPAMPPARRLLHEKTFASGHGKREHLDHEQILVNMKMDRE